MSKKLQKELVAHFSDSARKAAVVGRRVEIPKILDEEGEVRDVWASPDSRFRFNLRQARFLRAYEKNELDLPKACEETKLDPEWAVRFLKTRQVVSYFDEKNRLKAIAEVGTPEWTKAKMIQGVTGEWAPERENLAAKCLGMLKEIHFPKAIASLNVQNNTFQMPSLTPEQAAQARLLFDTIADQEDRHVA